jgi:hypothetical protein
MKYKKQSLALIKQAAQTIIAAAEAQGLPVTDVLPLVQSTVSKIIKRKKK